MVEGSGGGPGTRVCLNRHCTAREGEGGRGASQHRRAGGQARTRKDTHTHTQTHTASTRAAGRAGQGAGTPHDHDSPPHTRHCTHRGAVDAKPQAVHVALLDLLGGVLEGAVWLLARPKLEEGAADWHARGVKLVQKAARVALHAQPAQPVRAHGLAVVARLVGVAVAREGGAAVLRGGGARGGRASARRGRCGGVRRAGVALACPSRHSPLPPTTSAPNYAPVPAQPSAAAPPTRPQSRR